MGVHGLCFGHQDGISRNNSVVPSRYGDESIKSREICILKDFNASLRLNPLFHKPGECQRDYCCCVT